MTPCWIILNNTPLILIQCSRRVPELLSHLHFRVNFMTPNKPLCKAWVTFWCLDDVNPRAPKALTLKKILHSFSQEMCTSSCLAQILQSYPREQADEHSSPIQCVHPSRKQVEKDGWGRSPDTSFSLAWPWPNLRYNMQHNLLSAYDVPSTVLSILNSISFKP